ncbi:hypothetical protein EOL96_04195 [Candidatus Saccharibacteria bacterium]|nr:hypothetical protein [Candidatus Saccharibacteria bacterium]
MSYEVKRATLVLVAANLVASILLSIVGGYVVQATTSQVTTSICATQAATLQLVSPVPNSVVDTASVTINGQVHRISQYQVFIDGNPLSMQSLDAGATSFSYSTTLPLGSHTLRFVGIDPCTQHAPEASITLVYDPNAQPTPQPTPGGTLPPPVQGAVDRAQQVGGETIDYMQGQVDQASQSKPASSLVDIIYQAMVVLDLAPVTAGSADMNRMVARAVIFVTGVSFIVLAHPIITLYHAIRYSILRWNIHALPELVRHHAVLALRIVGTVLIIIPFILFT